MAVPLPGPQSRWRCALCGNLTRFDVVRTTRTDEYVHVDLAGHAVVDSRTVLSETAERVTCRWCGAVDRVEVVPRPGATADAAGSGATPAPGLRR